jgi:predicted nucleotidyltransferase
LTETTLTDFSSVVPELRSRGLLPDSHDSVFLSGSLVRGWGNKTSDLDVTVVSGDAWKSSIGEFEHVPLEPNSLQYEQTYVDGRRWDVEYWTSAQLEQVLGKITREQFADERGAWRSLSYYEVALLERLPYAQPADDGEWLRHTQRRLTESAHGSVLAARSLREADGCAEDATGQLDAGDLHSAVISARLALQHAVDALTASHGQVGSLWPKWRARRMRLIDTDVLSYERYWRLETMRDYRPEDARAWVEQVIGVCQRISMAVEL